MEEGRLWGIFPCQVWNCAFSLLQPCSICRRGWCQVHGVDPALHTCPLDSDGLPFKEAVRAAQARRYATLIGRQGERVEQAARNAVVQRREDEQFEGTCTAHLEEKRGGAHHYMVPLLFSDGEVWAYREAVPLGIILPPMLESYKLMSEIAAQLFASGWLLFQAPAVRGLVTYDEPQENWSFAMDMIWDVPWTHQTILSTKKAYLELAEMYIKIHEHPLPTMGSPILTDEGAPMVGGLIDLYTIRLRQDAQPSFVPASTCPNAFWRACIGRMISGFEQGLIPVDRPGYLPTIRYLMHLDLLDCVDLLYRPGEERTAFYLKHGDERGGNWMWDDVGELAGLIDWEWSRVTTAEEAFAAPRALYDDFGGYEALKKPFPREAALISAFEELGRPELADYVCQGRKYDMLHRCLGAKSNDIRFLLVLRYFLMGEDTTPGAWLKAAYRRHSTENPGKMEDFERAYWGRPATSDREERIGRLADACDRNWEAHRAPPVRQESLHYYQPLPFDWTESRCDGAQFSQTPAESHHLLLS